MNLLTIKLEIQKMKKFAEVRLPPRLLSYSAKMFCVETEDTEEEYMYKARMKKITFVKS